MGPSFSKKQEKATKSGKKKKGSGDTDDENSD